tara:strand:+ start:112 stop:564 length:453 start_codon:yes stop_codon:yes gene_type:complete
MGSKRIGLARMEALMENLKRELAMQGTSLSGIERGTKSVSSTGALTAADSGKIVTLTGSAFTLSLPPVSGTEGVHFWIVSGAAENYVLAEDSGDDNVLTMVSVNASATERDHAFSNATLSTGAIGDRFHVYSNGTYWVITAFANAAVAAA